MDDEDLREQEESRQISTADGFAGFGTHNDQAARHALDDIFKPVEDSMGERLLNRMGWKKGQGIGPRVRRLIDPGNATSEVKEFPPEDSPMLEFSQKNDTRGLGTEDPIGSGVNKNPSQQHDLEEAPDEQVGTGFSFLDPSSTKVRKVKSSGIGVGSLNDTGSDDEDPYEMGPKVSYNRVLGGEKKAKKTKKLSSIANPLLKSAPKFVSRKLPTILSTLRKCHDGRLPLTGFVLVDSSDLDDFGSMSLSDEKYKPPEVPEGWQPKGLLETAGLASTDAQATSTQSTSAHQQQTARSRANILKEAPLPSKSIFDFLSPAARDRLAAASGKTNLPPALNEAPPSAPGMSSSSNDEEPCIAYPALDATTASTALSRLRKDKDKPYADDLPKQGRYKDFLRFSSESTPITQRIPPLRAPTHKTDDEHLAELHEFAITANLFRPATGFLASRFTSAASASTSAPVNESDASLNQVASDTQDGDELLRRPIEKPKDPAEEAARMGLFGIATRSTIGFYPTKLVCKRFGVDLPSV